MGFSFRFWGVRGTIPCPAPTHMAYGGNTSCVEVTVGGHHIALDAGTGLRLLGKRWTELNVRGGTLLLSHTHLDHISGFPFFAPAFQPGFALNVIAGHLKAHQQADFDIKAVLARQMERPLFPVPMKTMGCSLTFEEIQSGETFKIGNDVIVRTAPLNHPDGATGYRIEYRGRSVSYITDTEHVLGRPDQSILDLITGTDVMIYDATYTDEEFAGKIGWGHSTWREGIKLAKMAGVGRLALFHHEPDHDDTMMAAIEREAQAEFPNVFAAREGKTVELLADA